MPYILVGIIVIAVVIYVLIKINDNNNQQAIYEIIEKYGEFDINNMSLHINDEMYKVILFKIPHGELTINSPMIWETHGSRGQRLIHMDQYLKTPEKKIVIVYPSVSPIKRFINENEMVFVKHSFFLNMYVIRSIELEDFLKKLRD